MKDVVTMAADCPVCVGNCGVESPVPGDWHDCEFCDSTGQVAPDVAYRYLIGGSLWASENVDPGYT